MLHSPPSTPSTTAHNALRWSVLTPLAVAALVACGGGDNTPEPKPEPAPPVSSCPETGPYACQSGETEPLYTFQWALNYVKSWFTDNADAGAYGGGLDLNVEPVHRQGIKGQGVNVLVIDSGVDLGHEDLAANADYSMSWNFETNSNDPSPLLTGSRDPHGTLVAGVIGASQNGKGVMGIAPQVKLGGAALITGNSDIGTVQDQTDAYGGAAWSSKAHVINASYGGDEGFSPYYPADSASLPGLRSLKSLRDGKGIVYVKSAGNSFLLSSHNYHCGKALVGFYDCTNPANDVATLEPNVIVTAALNAKGRTSNYSSAGSVVWITGLAGEYGSGGRYGELAGIPSADITSGRTGDGPTLFSTDIRGCTEGASQTASTSNDFLRGVTELTPGVQDNPNCDYAILNGTSAAAPSITGVVALMLSANPELTWRDVRDILRQSARIVDPAYEQRKRSDLQLSLPLPYNSRFDLTSNSMIASTGSASDIATGSTQVPVELGWTTNAAGNKHSNWYGFGVPDAARAVELAQLYKKEPSRSRSATQVLPAFQNLTPQPLTNFRYQQVSLLAEFEGKEQEVDQFQVRLSGSNICLASVGIAVQSPSGTVSLLKMPLDHLYNLKISSFQRYGLGSYAFYGEQAKGTWKVFALASNPTASPTTSQTCAAAPADGLAAINSTLKVEARVIAQ